MKKVLYILFTAVILLAGCVKTDFDSTNPNITAKDGEVTLSMDLKIQGTALQAVETRAGETFAGQDKENVTSLRGYAFVFEEDLSAEDHYSDNSKLLQKVAFKSVQVGGESKIFITLKEQSSGCFIRLMTCMTEEVYQEMTDLVSQQMIDEGTATGPVTVFSDYKNISVGLKGYYANADNPNPTQLTSNLAFPLASPGIDMPNGISQTEIDNVKNEIYMVPVASKLDVTAATASGFALESVTLLNGAKRARMRSTILENDDVTLPSELSLPINLGGVVQYESLDAINNTTTATPIYFYPNNGDGPFDTPLDPDMEDETNLSDPYKTKNPTYLIIKGRAAGYDVDGYYKIPIRYKFQTVDAGGVVSTAADYTYNIVRNNHYKVNLISVNNAGYSTFEEAVNGPANDIVYDITIDDPTSDDRNELIVSNNGTHYMELKGSEVYVKARSGNEGVNCSFDFKFVSADNIPEYDGNMPKVYFTTTNDNIVLGATEVDVPYGESKTYTLGFNVKSAGANQSTTGDIIVRWGELYKKIPVSYENKHAVSGDIPSAQINGTTVFADADKIEGTVNDINGSYTDNAHISGFILNGGIVANTTYNGRNFDGYVYPTDRSKGIRRVYYAQASNFGLIDKSKGENAEALYSTDGTAIQKIVYRSTGVIYSITDGTTNTSGRREYEVKGDVNSVFSDTGFSNFHPEGSWGAFVSDKKFSFEATDINTNQDPDKDYVAANSHLANTESLTLTNFADEVKVYKFQLDQYALPYIGSGYDSYDSENEIYYWYCSNVADCSYWFHDAGDKLGYSPWVYNAHYVAAEQADGGTWEWVNAPTENNYRGGDDGRITVDNGISVDKENPATNQWRFFGIVKDRTNKGDNQGKNQAYFDLKLTNSTDEMVRLRIRFRRDDGN